MTETKTNWISRLLETAVVSTQILIVLAVFLVGWNIFKFFTWKEVARFSATQAISASEQDVAITSLAHVDLIWVKPNGSSKWKQPSVMATPQLKSVFKDAQGFCVHSYEVGFGYSNLSDKLAALKDKANEGGEIPKPSLLTVNTIQTQNSPDKTVTYCQGLNASDNRIQRDEQIRLVLDADGVLVDHELHGMHALANLLDAANQSCRGPRLDSDNDKESCWSDALTRQLEKELQILQAEQQAAEKVAVEIWKNATNLQPADLAVENFETLIADQRRELLDVTGARDDMTAPLYAAFAAEDASASIQQIEDWTFPNENSVTSDQMKVAFDDLHAFQEGFENLIRRDQTQARISSLKDGSTAGLNFAAFQLTLSTIAGVSQSRRAWLFFTKEDFYLQRDVSRVYYGSPISPKSIAEKDDFFSAPERVIEIQTPSVIAIDRETRLLVTRGNMKELDKNDEKMTLGAYANMRVLNSVQTAIDRLHPFAVATAKEIIERRVTRLLPDVDEVRFVRTEPDVVDLNFLSKLGLDQENN